MARKIHTLYVDDLTDAEIPEGKGGPVAFALDGEQYEIDLTDENAAKMRDALGMYVSAARRLPKSTSSGRRHGASGGRTATDRERTKMIREWAVMNGHMRPDSRGRIAGAIVEMYEAAAKGTQTTIDTPAPSTTAAPQSDVGKANEITGGAGFDAPVKAQGKGSAAKKAPAADKATDKESVNA